ncbi:hypothetical protein BIV57_15820 [Mangrovactinospora gilvigrisea]|uniref:site-specific DNA-methyltransferase (adenine-specific) n=2 Tax=Mangrovactinospora gilvigrisea TaxID=1428644 RepID=A0A1J7CA48_9ACTN|nr:hypothetical protein BIV57_15820 [Mangrovactinospora gilvigrisea]
MPAGGGFSDRLSAAVAEFGHVLRTKYRGSGNPEDQLRGPFENLMRSVGDALGLPVALIGEVPLVDLRARPDYEVLVGGASVGYVELKQPGTGGDPAEFSGRNAEQWAKLSLLPNVLVSDGDSWSVHRGGRRIGPVARMRGSVRTAGRRLAPADGELARVVQDFLLWHPTPPRTVGQLVLSAARLCKLLCSEVAYALAQERVGARPRVFRGLADDWRALLFPDTTDAEFADQFAQTIVFSLLQARFEGIVFEGEDLHGIATKLAKKHALMGKALEILTADTEPGLSTTLSALLRVVEPIEWSLLDDGSGDAVLRLYEEFLQIYDPQLRKQTGSYYTDHRVVAAMTRITNDVLRERLGIHEGLASRDVVTIDPAMGTGTFLLQVLKKAAEIITDEEGDGAVGPRLREMVGSRLIGFEKQAGPFAVAEVRTHSFLRDHRSTAPASGLQLYLTDTLDDPEDNFGWLAQAVQLIAESRRQANRIKREVPVMVVLGNPPHDVVPRGAGKWIECGSPQSDEPPPIDAFRLEGNGRHESKMSNMYVYFWRWATRKVFDLHQDSSFGVVTLISPRAWINGPGFAGMRRYLREVADEGWIIDISPEGQRSSNRTRIFPAVAQELCIAIFARWKSHPAHGPVTPAQVHRLRIEGSREEKIERLSRLTLDDSAWRTSMSGSTEPFVPAASGLWASSPALADLMPWSSRGVTPGRMWVYAPDKDTLTRRWNRFLSASRDDRRLLFGEARDRTIDSVVQPLPGMPSHEGVTLAQEYRPHLAPVRVGYRSFDRQWIIPDHRLMVVGRPDLWFVRGDRQVYIVEQNAHPVHGGPGLVFTEAIPDMHHYDGRSGCTRPLYRDAAGTNPNVAPGLLEFLSRRLETPITAENLLAYVAAVTAHPAFTQRFRTDLVHGGVRVPLTADKGLWRRAVDLGERVLWLHTFGQRYVAPDGGRPYGSPRLPKSLRPTCEEGISDAREDMPERMFYEDESRSLGIGTGRVAGVAPAVRNYTVSKMNVLDRWFGYRRKDPAGRRRLPLDRISSPFWPTEWTTELLQLLNVLGLLVQEEAGQAALLAEVCLGPLLKVDDLEVAGIVPSPPAVRRGPRRDPPGQGVLFGT